MTDPQRIELTVKNYRCFSESDPVRLQLSPGYVALVGPNNSGKSCVLRLLFDLRDTLNLLAEPDQFRKALAERSSAPNLSAEVFSDYSAPRGVSLELQVPYQQSANVIGGAKLHLQVERDFSLRIQVKGVPSGIPGDQLGNTGGKLALKGTDPPTIAVGYEDLRSALAVLGAQALCIGAHRHVVGGSATREYDLGFGTQFVVDWSLLKVGRVRDQNRLAKKLEGDLASLLGFRTLEINCTAPPNIDVLTA